MEGESEVLIEELNENPEARGKQLRKSFIKTSRCMYCWLVTGCLVLILACVIPEFMNTAIQLGAN
jgi:hypothetical protein